MRFGLRRQEENIKASVKPDNEVTHFFENELAKLGNPDLIDEREYEKNQEFYKLSKNY